MSHIIRIVDFANGTHCPHAGEYVEAMDFEAECGRGRLTSTPDIAKAKKFSTAAMALMFWRTQSKTCPLRSDGEPNRPLTCATVSIEPVA